MPGLLITMASDGLANLSREDLVRRLQQAEKLVRVLCCTVCLSYAIAAGVPLVERLSGSDGQLTNLAPPLLAASARAAKGQQPAGGAEGCKRTKCCCGIFLS